MEHEAEADLPPRRPVCFHLSIVRNQAEKGLVLLFGGTGSSHTDSRARGMPEARWSEVRGVLGEKVESGLRDSHHSGRMMRRTEERVAERATWQGDRREGNCEACSSREKMWFPTLAYLFTGGDDPSRSSSCGPEGDSVFPGGHGHHIGPCGALGRLRTRPSSALTNPRNCSIFSCGH